MLYFTSSQISSVLGFNYFRTLKIIKMERKACYHTLANSGAAVSLTPDSNVILDLSSGWKVEDGREQL